MRFGLPYFFGILTCLWVTAPEASEKPKSSSALPQGGLGTDAPEPAAEKAIRLAREGKAQFDQKAFREAKELFLQAKSFARTPVLDLYLARCEVALGHPVSAMAAYREALAVPAERDNAPSSLT
jgi:TorA maturation chaperone TorD